MLILRVLKLWNDWFLQAQVIRDKSVESMPLFLSASSLINSMVWTAYGIIARDIFVIVQP